MVPMTAVTIGSRSSTQQFLDLGREVDSLRLAQRLVQVSDSGDAHDKLSPILHLVSASDSVRTLEAWASDDSRLRPWESLAARLWHVDRLMAQFPKVYDANRVADDFHGEMSHRYLAAMCASRLPEGEFELLAWLRTLKLWLLIRAVDAAEAGYVFEPSIRAACDEVRLACEDSNSPRVAWLDLLVSESSPTDKETFERHLKVASEARSGRANAGTSAGQRRLMNAFLRVIEGKWRQDPTARHQPLWQGELAPPREQPVSIHDGEPPVTDGPGANTGEDDEDGQDRGSTPVDVKSTPAEQRAKASSVLLVNQAEGHMLAWDWHSLILDEQAALIELVHRLVQPARARADRLGGALIAVALLTSSSARRIPRLKTGVTPGSDWKVDVSRGLLHRLPARRNKRWQAALAAPSATIAKWIRSLSGGWELRLADPIASALRETIPAGTRSLGTAWHAVCPKEAYEHWVKGVMAATPGVTRLTSPSLARALRHCTFEEARDHALARLVSSNSQTVLPSPCSYAAFTGGAIQGAAGPPFASLATWVANGAFQDANGAGSEMDVDSTRMDITLASLRRRIEVAAAKSDWVRHHNLFTAFCVIALLACTGARPVHSPFQSLAWFDFESGLVYVDDKRGGPELGSRLCILAPEVIDLVRDRYLPYLQGFGQAMARALPDVSQAIDEVVIGAPSATLPWSSSSSPSRSSTGSRCRNRRSHSNAAKSGLCRGTSRAIALRRVCAACDWTRKSSMPCWAMANAGPSLTERIR